MRIVIDKLICEAVIGCSVAGIVGKLICSHSSRPADGTEDEEEAIGAAAMVDWNSRRMRCCFG